MNLSTHPTEPWGFHWRSSTFFIVATMGTALLTDVFLYGFLVPILAFVLEHRLGVDPSLTQRISLALLAESALVMVVASPLIGHWADRSGEKRAWLLSGLAGALVGSLILALATSIFTLFTGRLIQSIASACVWVVGFATLADNVAAGDLGKTYGIVTAAIAAGTSGGPLLAGILYELAGYWAAWSSAFTLILFDVVLRSLMLEKPRKQQSSSKIGGRSETCVPDLQTEQDPLLSHCTGSDCPLQTRNSLPAEKTGLQFYLCLFRNGRFFGGIVCFLCYAILVSSFDTTLPLHVRSTFDWDSLPAGLLFAAFQGPGIVLAVFVGWLKDRVGTRHPTWIGFTIVVPLLWLIGIPGDGRFPWANENGRGPVLYSVTILGAGIAICLLDGMGTMEVTQAVDEIEAERPGTFGPNGGYSRALSISSMSWTLGMFIGPILSGYLVEELGYYEMSCVLGALSPVFGSYMGVQVFGNGPLTKSAAGMCAVCALVAFWNLKSTVPQRSSNVEDPSCVDNR